MPLNDSTSINALPDDLLTEKETVVQQGLRSFANALRPDMSGAPDEHVPKDWRGWLRSLFGRHFTTEFAEHHAQFWQWLWALERGVRPDPIVFCLARKGGKSTTVEAACVAAGASIGGREPRRRYVLYVSGTQDQADDHVKTIASHLESPEIASAYPGLSEARVTQYGDRWGWNRQRLVTASGFIVDAYGLFGSGRGAKLEEYRPDLIVLDDIDEEDDSLKVVKKKEKRIQQQVIPSGSSDRAIMFVQNLVHENSVMKRLIEGKEEWLLRREEIGPIPAVEDLEYEHEWNDEKGRNVYTITKGQPTWQGFDLTDAEDEINEVGPTSFLIEYQHETEKRGGGMFDHLDYRRKTIEEVLAETEFVKTVVVVDPSVSNTDDSDCNGCVVDALGADEILYRLFAWERRASPEQALRLALRKAVEYGAEKVVIETDQGGDTWKSVYKRAWKHLVESDDYPQITEHTRKPRYDSAKAGSTQKSKEARGMEMLEDYERGQVVHVKGTHLVLERGLNRAYETKPYDVADAAYWGWNELRNNSGGSAHVIN